MIEIIHLNCNSNTTERTSPRFHQQAVVLMPVLSFQLHIPLRLLCGGLLFTCNAVMWTFLAKALRYSSSSTWTTVTTTASNFISSVSDTILRWLLLFFGVFLVSTGPESVSSVSCRHSWAS